MRYFMRTTEPEYVEAFKALRATASERYKFFKQKIQEWGFDEIACSDFGFPTSFYKRCSGSLADPRGPAIDGFKGGERVIEQDTYFYRYQFRRSKKATELQKQFDGAPAMPPELTGDNYYRRPNIASAFCVRFGLPNNVFHGDRIGFALVHLLSGEVLVCSLPCREDDSKEAAPAVFPQGFMEITERAWAAEIDRHNKSVSEAGA